MPTRQRALWSRRLVSALVAVVVGPLMLLAAVPANAVRARPPGGSYEALVPARIADTRTGLGGVPNRPTRSLVVSTAGRAGVPAKGVSAVAVNITIRPGSVGGFVTVYPTGTPRPPTSNVNFASRRTIAQLAVAPVNGAGQFTIEASAPAHFVVDVEGYFTSADTASTRGLFNPLKAARIMDSRRDPGTGALGPRSVTVLQVSGRGGVPATGVSAVVINTTIAGATRTGYVTAYPTGSTRPATSTLNFVPGQTVANRAIVPVGTGGTISIYNDSGLTRPVIDVTGYFTDGVVSSTGGYFVPVPSSRVVDTRYWQTSSYLSTRTLKTQKIAGQSCVLSPARTVCGGVLVPPVTAIPRPIAVLLVITAVPRDGSGYLTALPEGSATPASSDVSFTSDAAASNLALVGLSSQGEVSVHNGGGLADVVEDVSGYFVVPAGSLPPVRVTKGAVRVTKGAVRVTKGAVRVTKGAARQGPGPGSGLLSRPVAATVAAPTSVAASSGPTPPRPSGKSVGGTVAPPAQLSRRRPGGSSAAPAQTSAAPVARTAAPAIPSSPTSAPAGARARVAMPVAALPQTSLPVTSPPAVATETKDPESPDALVTAAAGPTGKQALGWPSLRMAEGWRRRPTASRPDRERD